MHFGRRTMNLVGYKEEGNNTSGTMAFLEALEAYSKIKTDDKRNTQEYREVIKRLTDLDYIYCVSSNAQMDDDNTSIPRITKHRKFGPSLSLFTCWRCASTYQKRMGSEAEVRFILINKDDKEQGAYNGVFQTAWLLGAKNAVINEGYNTIALPIYDILCISGIGGKMFHSLYFNAGKLPNADISTRAPEKNELKLHASFNRRRCFEKCTDMVCFRYNTEWEMDYETALWTIAVVLPEFNWYELGQKRAENRDTEWIADNVKLKGESIFKTKLADKAYSAVIRGYDGKLEEVIEIESYAGTKIIDLTVYDMNPDPKRRGGYRLDKTMFNSFMTNVELTALTEKAKLYGMSIYKNYIQEQQGICEMTESYRKDLKKDVFYAHGFCPDIMKQDNGENIEYPFVWRRDEEEFFDIPKEDMQKALVLMKTIKRFEKTERNKKPTIEFMLYSGQSCTKEDHYEIGSRQFNEKVEANRKKDLTVTDTYMLSRTEFLRTCKNCGDKCFHGRYCVKQVAEYLFYLKEVGRYKEMLDKWEEVRKTDEIRQMVKDAEDTVKRLMNGEHFYVPFTYADETAPLNFDDTIYYSEETRPEYEEWLDISDKALADGNRKLRFVQLRDDSKKEEYLALFTTKEKLRAMYPRTISRIGRIGQEFVKKNVHKADGIVLDYGRPILKKFLKQSGFDYERPARKVKLTCPKCGKRWVFDETGLSEGELYNAQCPKCGTFVVRTRQEEE